MNMRIVNGILMMVILVTFAGCSQIGKTVKGIGSLPAKTGDLVWNFPDYVKETAKIIWGSSTQSLENARADAISNTYRCSFSDCYDAVLALGRSEWAYTDYREEVEESDSDEEDSELSDEEREKKEELKAIAASGHFDIFINDRKNRHIVVMGIKGSVDTTEAGIFFTQPTLTTVKLEVASQSSNAKRKVADIVFNDLSSKFSAVE